ncbi:hypothetical protein SEA_YECEY3_101 [Mycobacterium phage Yecey3]|uniref:Uncharacterized protein n=1 Tax=Mycobacterium phage Yecey3 TaxID=2656617 RepID=A0A649VA21_9CAUD|nr:hypothetical protein KIV58_gp008 [Mycobacterium phage Yecey3]QGJ88855.1 hypothetical protein SEA_YECEY3_101 [Mycobacterium phage Yecey3]
MTLRRDRSRLMDSSKERRVYIQGIGWVYCRGNSYYRR